MILVDLSQVIIANLMVNLYKSEDFKLEENMCRHMILNSLRSYNHQFNSEYGQMVICCDGANTWRKQVFPNYKIMRSRDKAASKVDWNDVYRIVNKVRDEIKNNLPFYFLHIQGCEGDDLIAVLARYFSQYEMDLDKRFNKTLIISGDKDFQQLQRYSNVSQFHPIKKEFIKCNNPLSFLKEHIIRGDLSDGVPNMLSPDDVFISGERQKPIRQTWLNTVIPQKPAEFCTDVTEKYYHRNRQLIDFTMIPEDISQNIIEQYKNQELNMDKEHLKKYFEEHVLFDLSLRIDNFYGKF